MTVTALFMRGTRPAHVEQCSIWRSADSAPTNAANQESKREGKQVKPSASQDARRRESQRDEPLISSKHERTVVSSLPERQPNCQIQIREHFQHLTQSKNT